MRVCAHINYGPYTHGQRKFDSIKQAIDYFRSEVVDNYYRSGTTDESDGCYVMHLFRPFDRYSGEECECEDSLNYHDYPFAAYSVGPRNGLRKDYV